MKIIGILLLALASVCTCATLTSAERKRVWEAEGVYRLLLAIQHGVCEEAKPLFEIYKDFSCEALEETPFMRALKENGLAYALKAAPPPLPDTAISSLSLYAADLGKRFAHEELLSSKKECEAFRLWLDAYRRELPSRIKIKRTLSLFGGFASLLLLI